ncbi:MAG: TonB-dependent receptor [Flavobacteriaceae bacterium]|nr:TonB-dependent receptor [Flavobacteriaceae bacterium]
MRFIIYLFQLSCCFISAQSLITGTVYDESKLAVPYADILLILSDEQSSSDRTLTDENGMFTLETSQTGVVQIQIISMGFEPMVISDLEIDNNSIDLGSIVLFEAAYALDDVKVTAKKIPFIRKIDRAIINLEDDASTSGSSILDVLERTPGIIVDRQNESITMLGKTGVNVMINGKMSYMPASAIVQYLNGLRSENATSIELITTPPSKFDAEGNAGFINIELKKNADDGYNGNIASSLGTAKGKTSEDVNLNFNVNSKKSNLAFNYSIINSKFPITFDMTRNIEIDGVPNETYLQAKRDNTRVVQNIRFGYDYEFSEKLTLALTVSGYENSYKMIEEKYLSELDEVNFDDNYYTTEDNYWKNAQMGVSASYRFKETKIDFISDYLQYSNKQPVYYSISINEPTGTEKLNLQTTKNSPFEIFANSIDLETNWDEKITFNSGVKHIINSYQNKTNFFENSVANESFSTDSQLDENISAIYSQVQSDLSENIKVQAGLRFEYATSKIFSNLTKENLVDRTYKDFFPSLFLSYKINDFNNINLSVNRRINRPAFTDMAPFLFFVDLDQAFQGNVELKPSYTNNIQVDYRFKSINLNLQYANETDLIARFQPKVNQQTGFITITPQNIDKQKTITAIVSYSFFPIPDWNLRLFTTVSHIDIQNDNDLGTYDLQTLNYRLNINNTISLNEDFSIQLWGYYNSKSFFGISTLDPNGSLNIGLQKKFNAYTLSLQAENILDTQDWQFLTENPDANYRQQMNWSFRPPQVKLSLSYRFGDNNVKVKQIRETEETKRMSL